MKIINKLKMNKKKVYIKKGNNKFKAYLFGGNFKIIKSINLEFLQH